MEKNEQNLMDQKTLLKIRDLLHKQEIISWISIGSLFILAIFVVPFIQYFKANVYLFLWIIMGIVFYFIFLWYISKTYQHQVAIDLAGRSCCNNISNQNTRFKITFYDGNFAFFCDKHLIEISEKFSREIKLVERIDKI